MVLDLKKFEDIQEKISRQVDTSKTFDFEKIKRIAGFDCAFFDDKIVCAGVVFDAQTLKIIEKKYSVSESFMPYVPGFLAFREGPAIIQTYYDLENEPDILIIDGHGIAHQKKCGLAAYVGIELEKPCIGVAKSLVAGKIENDKIIINDEVCGATLITKKYANPLFISPGHLIGVDSSIEIARRLILQPHKLPEPLYVAHRLAKNTAIKLSGNNVVSDGEILVPESEQERVEKEFGVNSRTVI